MGSILVVDDSRAAAAALSQLIEHAGHTSQYVTSGEEALDKLRGGFVPDAMILDLMMPGVGGDEVLRLVRSNPATEDMPVIVLTAVSDPQVIEYLRQRGASDYWIKASFNYDKLPALLARHLNSRAPDA